MPLERQVYHLTPSYKSLTKPKKIQLQPIQKEPREVWHVIVHTRKNEGL